MNERYNMYRLINTERKVNLSDFLKEDEELRKEIGFATSSEETHEDLHWEESYEFLIPQDASLTVKIFHDDYRTPEKGEPCDRTLSMFQEITVEVGKMLVIYPEHCHRVIKEKSGRFMALKVQEKFKVFAKPPYDKSGNKNLGRCSNRICSIWSLCKKIGDGSIS